MVCEDREGRWLGQEFVDEDRCWDVGFGSVLEVWQGLVEDDDGDGSNLEVSYVAFSDL